MVNSCLRLFKIDHYDFLRFLSIFVSLSKTVVYNELMVVKLYMIVYDGCLNLFMSGYLTNRNDQGGAGGGFRSAPPCYMAIGGYCQAQPKPKPSWGLR